MGNIFYAQIMNVSTEADLPTAANIGQLAYIIGTDNYMRWNGTLWTPSSRIAIKRSTVAVNGKTTGPTKIYTLEANSLNFYPTDLTYRAVNISGVTTPPTITVGSNASAYDNIAKGSLLSTVMSTLAVGAGVPIKASVSPGLAAATDIYANVTSGALATNYIFNIDIEGYYF